MANTSGHRSIPAAVPATGSSPGRQPCQHRVFMIFTLILARQPTERLSGLARPAPPPPPGEDGRGGTSPCRDLHFRIYHDQGTEEITLEYENAESGWNNLGRYYLSSDTATVEMTNQSIGNYVIGDAVKWVLQK